MGAFSARVQSGQRWLKRFFSFNDPRYIYILAGAVFVVGLVLISWFGYGYVAGQASSPVAVDPTPAGEGEADQQEVCPYRRKLDGRCVKAQRLTDPKLVAVMIENNYEAWPLSGLAAATIVYEAPVEGGIPRFMVIYPADADVKEVGPVRSARPYYLDWLSEYGQTMYLHVGGSPEALDRIDNYKLFSVDEFYRERYFWRSSKRPRPHNTYTSSRLWQKALGDYGKYYDEAPYQGWRFETAALAPCAPGTLATSTLLCVERIRLDFAHAPVYHVSWVYNSSTQRYTRYQAGERQTDSDGLAIAADTIIVQRVRAVTLDEIGRKQIDTIGTGEVLVFRNGRLTKGIWKKESRESRTQFYDQAGELIPLQPGSIWVEVLAPSSKVEYE